MVEDETCRLYSDIPTRTVTPVTPVTHIHPCTQIQIASPPLSFFNLKKTKMITEVYRVG